MSFVTDTLAAIGRTIKPAPPRPRRMGTSRNLGRIKHVARRNYHAGDSDAFTQGWTTTVVTSDDSLKSNLVTMVARSREQARSNPYMAAFLKSCRRNIVGPRGMTLKAQTQFVTPAGAEPDIAANLALENGWRAWGRRGTCEMSGTMSWTHLQKLWVTTVARDGEFLARKIMSRDAGEWRFALQVIDPQRLDVNLNKRLDGGRRIVMGIELDQYDRPLRYWLRASVSPEYDLPDARYQPIPADEIIHSFVTLEPGQKRGIPWAHAALYNLRQLGMYEEATIVAARLAAATSDYFTPSVDSDPFPDGTEEDLEARVAELEAPAEPGDRGILPVGWTVTRLDSKYPDASLKDFMRALLRGVAAGTGSFHPELGSDYEGISFSAGRLGRDAAQDEWEDLQQWGRDDFYHPIYDAWLSQALLTGKLTIWNNQTGQPEPLNPTREEKYLRVEFKPRRWRPIDESKAAQADQIRLANKTKSPQEIIRENGGDPDLVLQEWQQWRDKLEELGLVASEPPPTPPSPEPDDTDDEEDDRALRVLDGRSAR